MFEPCRIRTNQLRPTVTDGSQNRGRYSVADKDFDSVGVTAVLPVKSSSVAGHIDASVFPFIRENNLQ